MFILFPLPPSTISPLLPSGHVAFLGIRFQRRRSSNIMNAITWLPILSPADCAVLMKSALTLALTIQDHRCSCSNIYLAPTWRQMMKRVDVGRRRNTIFMNPQLMSTQKVNGNFHMSLDEISRNNRLSLYIIDRAFDAIACVYHVKAMI